MPELPEVHTISTDLNGAITGSTITDINIVAPYKTLPSNDIFVKSLRGQRIERVFRIAKNICFELKSGNFLIIHLAMTGQLLVKKDSKAPARWERIVFLLEGSGQYKALKFCDMRMFGKASVVGPKTLGTLRQKYGPEPINESLTPQEFLIQLKSKNTTIKNVLLDQAIIAGLGNIYATDALFLAKIHPETATKNITENMAADLLLAAKTILQEGIEHRGSTLNDKMYVDAFGKYGIHQNHFKIYGKEKCDTCGTKVVVIRINGRNTYFCPMCQPINGQRAIL